MPTLSLIITGHAARRPRRYASALLVVLLAAGCHKAVPGSGIADSGAQMAMARAPERADTAAPAAMAVALAGSAPQSPTAPGSGQPVDPVSFLAYAYGMRLELPGDRLIAVMEGHAAACRDAGLRVCQLVGSRRDGDPQDSLSGSLSLRAEPQWLQRYMKGVQSDAANAAGRVTAQWTTTEDLTREIVDTEATLRAKRSLRDRLQTLLTTRQGSLADLLSVERELARVQGEIDSTESTLAAMRTRVAMSALTIEYTSSARVMAGGTFEPLRLALVEFVAAVVESTATLITAIGALLPWLLVGTVVVWLLLRLRRNRRARRNPSPDPPAA